MASTPTFQPNPYANFDPSQWTNPYSQFYGKALPWPSSYAGTPTNALGQPIAPPQGMTLNQTPQQPQAPAAAPGAPNAWQNTLSMLANPGHVTTPGATVPQSPTSYQPNNGVLQAFLQNWQPAQSGPGSGFQQGFNKSLRGS